MFSVKSPKFKASKNKAFTQKVIMVAAEAAPFAVVGGASQVVSHLSKALKAKGTEVAVFIPKFGSIDEEKYSIKMLYEGLKVPTDSPDTPYLTCNIKTTTDTSGVVYYFLENHEYYEKRANVYGYSDDPTRWALLSRGLLEFIKLEIFVPDIIHTNDWHTGLVANYLKTTYANDPVLSGISSIYTIHSIVHQGMFNPKHVSELDYDDGRSAIPGFFEDRLNKINSMRRGILFADAVNTVSKTYAKEILTEEFGEGLDKLLLELRGKLFGIINGLDYETRDPAIDKLITKNYDIRTLSDRIENKRALQKEFDLPVDDDALLLGFVGRLDSQKGVDLIVKVLPYLFRDFDVQFVQVGGGDGSIVDMLHNLKKEFPHNIGIHPYPNFTLPHMLFAGTDCILHPSRFEPCGIVQLESMRYGAIPIVRKVGGLADTVDNYNAKTGRGTGFVFTTFDEFGLFGQVVRAYEIYKDKPKWSHIQKNAMKADYSWGHSAKEYLKLYDIATSFRTKPVSKGSATF